MWDIIIDVSKFITALGVIVGCFNGIVSKTFDKKLKPLTNRDRMQLRFEIVRFASELHKGIPHTRDEYLAVFELIDEYKEICKQLGIQNHVFEAECQYIDKKFQELDILKLGKEY
jgi:hypothetical protein